MYVGARVGGLLGALASKYSISRSVIINSSELLHIAESYVGAFVGDLGMYVGSRVGGLLGALVGDFL